MIFVCLYVRTEFLKKKSELFYFAGYFSVTHFVFFPDFPRARYVSHVMAHAALDMTVMMHDCCVVDVAVCRQL